jgi:hypothetical protein
MPRQIVIKDGPPKKKQKEYEPAGNQLKAYRVSMNEKAVAIGVPLGSIIHWHSHKTRPVVPWDVLHKRNMLTASQGWSASYNILSRLLSQDERAHLRSIINHMRSSSKEQLEGMETWRTSCMYEKVHILHAHIRLYTHNSTLSHSIHHLGAR